MTKRCLIIYNEPAPDALPDELDVLDQVNFINETAQSLGYQVECRGITDNFFSEIGGLPKKNLISYSTSWSRSVKRQRYSILSTGLLNMNHIPYTGCPVEATFITASKVLAPEDHESQRHTSCRRLQGIRSLTACPQGKEIYPQTGMGRRLTGYYRRVGLYL